VATTIASSLKRPEPQALKSTIDALAARFGNRLITSQAVREQHAHTTTWLASQPPDAVVMAQETADIQDVVRICAKHGVPVIAFGTGTSLEGQVNAPAGGVCIDLRDMNKILAVHAEDLAEFGGDKSSCIKAMIEKVVDRMYAEIDDNRFLEVTYANGDKEVMYFKDFNSGAMIQNVVDRGKKYAIKSVLETGAPGLRIQHLLDSIVDEFAENEDLPNTTNPDDWARISGKKGERIVYIRTLVTGKNASASRAIDTESNLGQYL